MQQDLKELYTKIGLVVLVIAIIQGVVLFSGVGQPAVNIGNTQANPDSGTPPLRCQPPVVLGRAGEVVAFAASGGTGAYQWSAPGGTPETGSGTVFATQYASDVPRTQKITVSSGTGQTYQQSSCIVTF
ncbi:MAG: hypothetical protein AAB864_02730 [Patescibacteria group bacterium]